MKVYAGIVAGGCGSRMGADMPKQYIPLAGTPILLHTVRAFLKFSDAVFVACPESFVEYTRQLVGEYATVIPGGKTRMESVKKILERISPKDDDIILTHDGVRPFISERIIKENIEEAKKHLACGTFIPTVDTICLSEDGAVLSAVPDRTHMYNVQTPQTFNINLLKELLSSCEEKEKFTDLCGLAVFMGKKVHMVMGDSTNIKITTPADITLAEAILSRVE
ncbi:MAG: 2-C-methyl-D-erythritol 4-phosphate cytidylyltransferase [Clostridia bacterium]|nr:2-C-methyl-D-erythritol 4-phosphate cytidylyltransferase [Clostridia bacterium]